MRETSLAAYEELVASGKLSERRAEALKLLLDYGPATAGELCQNARNPGIWKRFSELKRMGYAIEVGVRACGVTGFDAVVWAENLDPGLAQREMFPEDVANMQREGE